MSPPLRFMPVARHLDARLLDVALAVGLTVWTVTGRGVFNDEGRAVVLVAMTLAIAFLRVAPVAVLSVEVAGVVLLPSRLDLPQGLAVLIAAYAAAFYSDRRLIVGLLLVAAAVWLLAYGGQATIPRGLVPVVLVAPVYLAGTAMRRREMRAATSAARADRLEREREDALRAERARIARELHDVVTHSVSVMVLQTGAAKEIMDKQQNRSRDLLESVEASGRQALEELRRMLGLISEQDLDAPLSPQPDVTQIQSLVEQVQQTGSTVELCVEGEPRTLPGGVAVAAYRIVQEALTNVLKHAQGAASRVVVRWADAALELEIADRGPPQQAAGVESPSGRGLAGMRARAAMYGGTLDAEPGREGGYVVRARLPLERS